MQKKIVILVAMLMMTLSSAIAQITTSSMAGKVSADGEDVIGATIEAIHVPSGTRYVAVSNAKGMYTINGMRVGGPYEVTISYIGYEKKVVKDITLQLGETYNLGVSMNEDAQLLGDVIVIGKGSKFSNEKTGAATNISNAQITNMPSISRGITDYTRLSPYGGNGMSFGGQDGRTANFTVDGASFNNNFGLSDKLPGGGNPISIEAIEEMQVVISPFDVRQTGFIGGGVNAITKSGTNTYQGSAYIYHQNENMRGDAVNGETINGAREKDRKTTYGFTLGGPIIKNKLFLFVNGEMQKVPTVANRWRASENGVGDAENFISRTTLSDLQTVSDFVKQKYGYDTGSYTSFPADESNYKFLARMDWNITNAHHLALRYNYTKNRIWNSPNSSSMDGGSRMSGGRMSQYGMSFANSMYSMDNLVHSFSLDLNSRLSENLSNQFLATFTKADDVRGTDSEEFPFIDILKDDQIYMALGYELFTWNNAVHTTTWNIKDDVTYYFGNHKLMAGVAFEHQMADNQYMRNGTGYYRYRSLNDFLTGADPEIVCLTYGYNGESSPAARIQFNRLGFYAQDEWNINPQFKLSYGLRLDGLFFNNGDLMTNNAILGIDYGGKSVDTGKWPSSKVSFSPRLGFTWDVLGDKSLKVRGGTGLFEGRLPLVFFTNMPSNGGMVQYQAQLNSKNTDMSQFGGGLVTDANGKATVAALRDKIIGLGHPESITPEKGSIPSSFCGVDPDFKMPQVWKSSLAIDYAFPTSFPLTLTVEGIFNKNLNAAMLADWSQKPIEGFARFNGADNRPIFPSDAYYTYINSKGKEVSTSAYVLENTCRGYGWSTMIQLNARPAEWLNIMAAYTHSASKEVTSLPGSNASSVLNYTSTWEGVNNFRLHNSQNLTPDRFIANATIHDKSGNHYSLIYETWRGGYNYSFMTTNDVNGDGYNYDAIYVPTDQEVADRLFRFKSQDDQNRFMDYVHNNSYLSSRQGKYTEAYSFYSPWVHRIDFAYKHDFKVNVGKQAHKLQLSLDVKNVLNLFNSSWGVSKYLNPALGSDGPRVLKFEGVDKDGYATYSTPAAVNGDTKSFIPYRTVGQCWYASIGIKYCFN